MLFQGHLNENRNFVMTKCCHLLHHLVQVVVEPVTKTVAALCQAHYKHMRTRCFSSGIYISEVTKGGRRKFSVLCGGSGDMTVAKA